MIYLQYLGRSRDQRRPFGHERLLERISPSITFLFVNVKRLQPKLCRDAGVYCTHSALDSAGDDALARRERAYLHKIALLVVQVCSNSRSHVPVESEHGPSIQPLKQNWTFFVLCHLRPDWRRLALITL